MQLADESYVVHLRHVIYEIKQTVHLYSSVVSEEVEDQPVVNNHFIGTKSSRGRGERQYGGNHSSGRGNDVGVGYEKKASVADKFVSDNDNFVSNNDNEPNLRTTELEQQNLFEKYLILMIDYMMKNQMKVGRKMSTCNGKLLLIPSIVFLVFLIVHNLL